MNAVEVHHVTKKFGDYKASNDINLSIKSGQIFGLLGPNGAGKTTLIRMLNNIYIPDEGDIKIFDSPITQNTLNRMAYLPEERGLYRKMKIIDQLVYFGQLKGLSAKVAKQRSMEWMIRLEAADWASKKIQDLSKGMQQKIQFIATILHNPDLFILDEPFSGFDPINSELIKNILLEFKAQGKTIILSTHLMNQVEQLCDNFCLINKGVVLIDGSVRDVKRSFGKNKIIIEFEGDNSFVNEIQNCEVLNLTQNRAEIKYLGNLDNPNELVTYILSKVIIHKFEMQEPSLNEIFIETVNKSQGAK